MNPFGTNSSQHQALNAMATMGQSTPGVPGVSKCELCGKIYINATLLQQHVEKCKRKKYVCVVCGLRTLCPAELKRHMKVHDKN